MAATISKVSVRARLLKAAQDCFLADEFHNVSTRQIADKANANVSMIRYYFGSKLGLYEEMIRDVLDPILSTMEGKDFSSLESLSDLLKLYYSALLEKPEFPKLILKVLALNHGPGKRFVHQLLERGRNQTAKSLETMQATGRVSKQVNPEILRMTFVSIAITPLLLKEIFEEQMEHSLGKSFYDAYAEFNGNLLSHGLSNLFK